MVRQIFANVRRAGLNIIGARVDLDVVETVVVGGLHLSGGRADYAIAACGFSVHQDRGITVHAHKDDVDICHYRQQISEPPRLAQDVIHYDVVPGQRHSSRRAMKSGAGAAQHLGQTRFIEIASLRFGAHSPGHVHTHVETTAYRSQARS